ncbi:hypothetical protein Mgra_00009861 [Meloidogyne graminicola]|uniref:Uncharacterized protein n=1 Tax=Meloidogyne graminicola TaxID=189291 RepID=A0A8S9Z8C5_9BILA|nr:hypothetical protein Mgra_00009861 [Meloidogyne graminicola]
MKVNVVRSGNWMLSVILNHGCLRSIELAVKVPKKSCLNILGLMILKNFVLMRMRKIESN